MSFDQLQAFLFYGAAINYAILLLWFGVFVFAHDWLFRQHTRWFQLTPQAFDALNYAGVAVYKIGIILFFLVPALALMCLRG